MKTFATGLSAAALLCSLSLMGCSEAERTYNCAQICDTYATCLDSELDKTDCVDKCEDTGDADPNFAAQASQCEECLEDKDCASSTLNCSGKCSQVIAESALGQSDAQD